MDLSDKLEASLNIPASLRNVTCIVCKTQGCAHIRNNLKAAAMRLHPTGRKK